MLKFFKPLSIVLRIKSIFILWLIFTIVIGLSGVILTISLNFNASTWTAIMKSGSLYSIGIAMCSSFVSVFLINVIKNRNNILFASYKMVCVGIGVILMLFMAGYYSSLMTGNCHSNKIQYFMYFISIMLCTYSFCVENMEQHYEDYKDLDDNAVDNLKKSAKTATTDGQGIKL